MTDLEFYKERCGGNTIGHFIRAVLKIDNPEDAKRFYNGAVADIQQEIDHGKWQSRHTAVEAANANIGWCFGEGMDSERISMWRSISPASHPVFGSMDTRPSTSEAIAAGIAAARGPAGGAQ